MSTTTSTAAGNGPITPRPAGRWPALLGAEIRRVWHRRMLRITALIVLGGSVAIWAIVIAHSLGGDGVDPEVTMVAAAGTTILLGSACGYLIGASVGGADWASRSMTLQLMWEPRRLRLLVAKWVAILVNVLLLTASIAVVNVAMALLADAVHSSSVEGQTGSGGEIAALFTRGWLVVLFAASFGYLVALLVRNTGAALGIGFGYFLVVENFLTFFLIRFDLMQFSISLNIAALLTPDGVPAPTMTGPATRVTSLHGFVELSVLVAIAAGLAFWSFGRRDVQ